MAKAYGQKASTKVVTKVVPLIQLNRAGTHTPSKKNLVPQKLQSHQMLNTFHGP